MTSASTNIKIGVAAAALMACFAALPEEAAACSDSPYMGSVCFMATDYCPYGYLVANGQEMQLSQNQALYSLLGYRFGGDNKSIFRLPDLRGRVPVGTGLGPGLTVNINIAQKTGAEAVLLTQAQVPLVPHTHTATFTGVGNTGSGPLQAIGTVNLPVTGTTTGQTLSGNASLPVTADAKIGTSTPAGGTAALSNNVPLKTASGPASQIYATGGANNVTVGPPGAVSGTATGPLTGVTVSNGTVSGTATGTIRVPVTGATGITGGSVTVNPAAQSAAQAVSMREPGLGLTACIAVAGTYPTRP